MMESIAMDNGELRGATLAIATNLENHALLLSEADTIIKRGEPKKLVKYAKSRGIIIKTMIYRHFVP